MNTAPSKTLNPGQQTIRPLGKIVVIVKINPNEQAQANERQTNGPSKFSE